jgi:VWFA-related protein
VVVTNGNDEPVMALHQQDFQLFEDGKPQAIDLFEEHTAPASAPSVAPVQVPPHVFSNQPAAPRSDAVNVLLLDSLNTEVQDQAVLHKQIAGFLEQMQPGAPVAIFSLGSKLELVQGFTADTALLRAALDRKMKAPVTSNIASHTRQDQAGEDMQQALMAMSGARDAGGSSVAELKANQRGALTLQGLGQLARSLASVPGRKNVIWFASSFPVAIFPTAKEQQSPSRTTQFNGTVRETAGLLTASRVAVYPVDAQGIQVDRSMDADTAGSAQGDNFAADAGRDLALRNANSAAMGQLAADTGGEALLNSNNLSQAVTHGLQNGSHYYTLVYTPPSAQMDGKFHRIEIKLAEGKAKLSYRRGYYADAAPPAGAEAKPAPAADPLPALLAHGLPASTQVLYRARIQPASPQPAANAPRAGGNSKLTGSLTRYKVDLFIDTATVVLDSAPDGTHNGKIEVALVAYESGKPVNWTGETLGLVLNPDSYAQVERAGIPVHLQLDLPQSDLWLSTGVYDLTARKAGTLEIPIAAQSATTP